MADESPEEDEGLPFLEEGDAMDFMATTDCLWDIVTLNLDGRNAPCAGRGADSDAIHTPLYCCLVANAPALAWTIFY